MLFFSFLLGAIGATPAAVFAHHYNRCAQRAAATALAAAEGAGQLGTLRKRVERNAAGADVPDVHYCRHCGDAIARNAPGSAIPYLHIATTTAACYLIPGEPVTWAEPAMPDAWLREVSAADLEDVDHTAIVLGTRCRHCRTFIEANPIPAGHAWRHVGGGPACWLAGADYNLSTLAEPEPVDEPEPLPSPTRPPLRAIPAPVDGSAFAHTLGGEL